jgi:hypothetical protein
VFAGKISDTKTVNTTSNKSKEKQILVMHQVIGSSNGKEAMETRLCDTVGEWCDTAAK